MSSTARIPATEVNGVYGALVKVMTRRLFGKVPDSMGYMWHNTRVLKDMMSLGQKIEKWDRLDPDLASYATIASAAYIGCSMCVDLNYFKAHHEGLDVDKAREVPRWRESEVFTPLERRVMEYAEGMSQTPVGVTDELVAALLDDLEPAALLELTSRVAFMNARARSHVSLGLRSEHFADSCGLAPIATRVPADT